MHRVEGIDIARYIKPAIATLSLILDILKQIWNLNFDFSDIHYTFGEHGPAKYPGHQVRLESTEFRTTEQRPKLKSFDLLRDCNSGNKHV